MNFQSRSSPIFDRDSLPLSPISLIHILYFGSATSPSAKAKERNSYQKKKRSFQFSAALNLRFIFTLFASPTFSHFASHRSVGAFSLQNREYFVCVPRKTRVKKIFPRVSSTSASNRQPVAGRTRRNDSSRAANAEEAGRTSKIRAVRACRLEIDSHGLMPQDRSSTVSCRAATQFLRPRSSR